MEKPEPQIETIRWKTKCGELDVTNRALVMGILNVTLDSFYDGGKYVSVEAAVDQAFQMAEDGADIIDVGGESTRPGSLPVPMEIERERVNSLLERLGGRLSCLISVDTSKAAVAEAAIERGAGIINDVTGLRGDPSMAGLAAQTGAGVIIMHMQGVPRDMQVRPHYEDVVGEVGNFFRQSLSHAVVSGINPACVAFDPGIGFGKTVAHNRLLLRHLGELGVNGRPLAVGVSRKSFLGKLIGNEEIGERLWPTVALTSLAREYGARIFRVHDVKQNVEALRMTEAILNQE